MSLDSCGSNGSVHYGQHYSIHTANGSLRRRRQLPAVPTRMGQFKHELSIESSPQDFCQSAPASPRLNGNHDYDELFDDDYDEEIIMSRKREHKRVINTKSADQYLSVTSVPHRSNSARRHLTAPAHDMTHAQSTIRSQSFRHRTNNASPKPDASLAKENGIPDRTAPRRRSTPNARKKMSMEASSVKHQRENEWPEAPQPDLLQLPDDCTRVRDFEIDPKGGVINRGDSFRRRGTSIGSRASDNPEGGSRSRTGSYASQTSSPGAPPSVDQADPQHDIMVLGYMGVGKSSLINQFMSSEHRNPFAMEPENQTEKSISVVIEGEVTEFVFFETEPHDQIRLASAYLVLYSVDSKASFRHGVSVLQELRSNGRTKLKPLILAGNKVDLARKRTVSADEAKQASKKHDCPVFEVSVGLNHGVDELLVGILAEIKQSMYKREIAKSGKSTKTSKDLSVSESIRRFSQRRGRGGGSSRGRNPAVAQTKQGEEVHSSCGNLVQRLNRFFKRRETKSVENLDK